MQTTFIPEKTRLDRIQEAEWVDIKTGTFYRTEFLSTYILRGSETEWSRVKALQPSAHPDCVRITPYQAELFSLREEEKDFEDCHRVYAIL